MVFHCNHGHIYPLRDKAKHRSKIKIFILLCTNNLLGKTVTDIVALFSSQPSRITKLLKFNITNGKRISSTI